MIKTNTFDEKIDEENSDENDDETVELTKDDDLEIDSEEEPQIIIDESIEGDNESAPPETEEIENLVDETELIEDIEDETEEIEEIGDESESVDKADDESELIEDIVEESELIEELPKELSQEDIKKQLREYHKNLIEAALYASGKPLNVEILSTKLEIPKKKVDELLNEIAYDYLERSTALIINQVGDSYQMAIKSEYVEKISKFASGGAIAEKYLRTLTIIALKQPILKSMVIKLRGSGAYEHVKYLLDNALIDAVKKGRSQELTTTDKYAEMFGLPKDKETMKQMMISQLGLGDQIDQQEKDYEVTDQESDQEFEEETDQEDESSKKEN